MEPSEKEEVRARTEIVALVSGYTTLRQTGRTFKGLCPFHQEKTPSFTVDPEKGRWHCFGACSTGGDVFTFLMRAEGLTFIEAAEQLAERAGVTLTQRSGRGGVDREAVARDKSERDRLLAANALAARFFQNAFGRVPMAKDYALGRKLAHETQQEWALGWAPGGFGEDGWGSLARFLQASGTHMADAEKAGLVFSSRSVDGAWVDKFWGRLMFPIHDVQERVVAFGGRLLVPAENAPKYLNSPETPVFSKSRVLFGLHRARRAIQETDKAVVVEGYLDVVQAHQAGFTNVVATLGTSLTEEHVRLLHRYTKNVVLSFDADEAGVRAALRAAALFDGTDERATLRILALPPGDDPDSLLARGDVAAFRRAIDKAVSVPEFRLRALRARADLSSDEGKMTFLRDALPVVAEVRSSVERDVLLGRLAPYHPAYASGGGRAEVSLRDDLDGFLARRAPAGGKEGGRFGTGGDGPIPLRNERILPFRRDDPAPWSGDVPPEEGDARGGAVAVLERPPAAWRGGNATLTAEQTLLRALLSPEWQPAVLSAVHPERFTDSTNARLATELLRLAESSVSPDEAINALPDPVLADYASALLLADGGEPLGEQAISEASACLERQADARALNKIRAETRDDGEGMGAGDDEILRRSQEVARRLRRGGVGDEPT